MSLRSESQIVTDFLISKSEIKAENEEALCEIIQKETGCAKLIVKSVLRQLKNQDKISISEVSYYPETKTRILTYRFGVVSNLGKKWIRSWNENASLFEKIKGKLQNNNSAEIYEAAKRELCEGGIAARKELIRIADKHGLHIRQTSSREPINLKDLTNEVLIEFVASQVVFRIPSQPNFDLERYWKDYYHGRRKGRSYPSGWSK